MWHNVTIYKWIHRKLFYENQKSWRERDFISQGYMHINLHCQKESWKVNKACQSSSHLKFHNRERGGMFQVRIMLELRFFTSEILHLNGLVSSVTPMHKVWSRFYNRPFCHLQSQQRPINLCNFNWAGQQI